MGDKCDTYIRVEVPIKITDQKTILAKVT